MTSSSGPVAPLQHERLPGGAPTPAGGSGRSEPIPLAALRAAAADLLGRPPSSLDYTCSCCGAAIGRACAVWGGSGQDHHARRQRLQRVAEGYETCVDLVAQAAAGDSVAEVRAAVAVPRLVAMVGVPGRWRLPSPAEVRAATLGRPS
jgi:hypothetical protein